MPASLHPRRRAAVHGTVAMARGHKCRCAPCQRAIKAASVEFQRWHRNHPGQSRRRPTLGARRRLLALAYIGYTQRVLAAAVGTTQVTIYRILNELVGEIYAVTDDRIRDVFDQLAAQPPPPATQHTRRAARWARQQPDAAPPMAWDDDDIDRPAGRPGRTTASDTAHRDAFVDEVRRLTAAGLPRAQIAQRLQLSESSLLRRLHRHGEHDLARSLYRTRRTRIIERMSA